METSLYCISAGKMATFLKVYTTITKQEMCTSPLTLSKMHWGNGIVQIHKGTLLLLQSLFWALREGKYCSAPAPRSTPKFWEQHQENDFFFRFSLKSSWCSDLQLEFKIVLSWHIYALDLLIKPELSPAAFDIEMLFERLPREGVLDQTIMFLQVGL